MSATSCPPRWWHVAHGADVGLAASGSSVAQVFEQMALAMTAVITLQPVETQSCIEVRCKGSDPELLLVDWLNELIFEMASRGMLFGRYEVSIDADRLTAMAYGEPVDPPRHLPAVEPKGATYTALSVHQDAQGCWQARCVVDV